MRLEFKLQTSPSGLAGVATARWWSGIGGMLGMEVVLTRRASLWTISLSTGHPRLARYTRERVHDAVRTERTGEINQQERANPVEEVHV